MDTKQPYLKPNIVRVDLADKSIVSMSDPCKDSEVPNVLGGCQTTATGGPPGFIGQPGAS